ncbi:hypothetical protein Goari_006463 [Gossypium aridum]|uniref:Uncharacterized protein n=1 Tax=Gossypium aridum TaxID=34290 RepID=A0A7J8XP78_GOSAI|nr:hypothetical protein [Gossypium aridum]
MKHLKHWEAHEQTQLRSVKWKTIQEKSAPCLPNSTVETFQKMLPISLFNSARLWTIMILVQLYKSRFFLLLVSGMSATFGLQL